MNAQAEILPPEDQAIDLIDAAAENPEPVLLSAEHRSAFVARVREVAFVENPDVSTNKGRDEIRAAAMKVVRAKSMLDKGRLHLTADLRAKVDRINAAGKEVISQLEAITDEVRAPLTEWEVQDKKRAAYSAQIIGWLRNSAVVTLEDTSATVRKRGKEVYEFAIDPKVHLKDTDQAQQLKDQAVAMLRAALQRLIDQEDQAAELQRLREEKEAREAEEQRAREAREAEEREAERLRLEAIQEDMRKRAEERRIADAAREAEERAAQAEREAAQREIDAANARAAEAEAEAKRLADAEAERAAQEERDRAEQARLERSRKHRAAVLEKVAQGILEVAGSLGVTIEAADAIAKAAAKQQIPALKIEFGNVVQ